MPPAPAPVPADGQWQRLDPRTVLTYPFAQGGPLVVVLLIAAVAGGAVEGLLIRLGATVGILAAFGGVHFWRFRYRLIDGRLETRSGLIGRTSKVINVDRIRGVDIEAKLAHRIAGVCALRIEHPGAAGGGRGRNRDGRDRIDAVSRAEGERLRNVLLHERAVAVAAESRAAAPIDPSGATPPGVPGDQVLLRMPLKWLLYAPFSLRLLFLGPAALLGVFNSLRDAGVGSDHQVDALTRVAALPVVAAIVVVVLVVTAIVVAVVTYWQWTVTSHGNDLVLTRGLLTRRTVAIERRRLRGVMVREPLAGRPFRAATLQVVLSGVTGNTRSALVPLGPRPQLERFAREFVTPCREPLRRHPRGALVRRMRRAAVPAVVLAGLTVLGVVLGWSATPVLAVAGILVAAIGTWWARASYRTLGHSLDDQVLYARHGVLIRHTETVLRTEPIGLRVRQSIFARRAGVASVDVALVARGFTRISDLEADDVHALATTLLGPL
jgi:putative membrane protein